MYAMENKTSGYFSQIHRQANEPQMCCCRIALLPSCRPICPPACCHTGSLSFSSTAPHYICALLHILFHILFGGLCYTRCHVLKYFILYSCVAGFVRVIAALSFHYSLVFKNFLFALLFLIWFTSHTPHILV